jgi:hypothetical protein
MADAGGRGVAEEGEEMELHRERREKKWNCARCELHNYTSSEPTVPYLSFFFYAHANIATGSIHSA